VSHIKRSQSVAHQVKLGADLLPDPVGGPPDRGGQIAQGLLDAQGRIYLRSLVVGVLAAEFPKAVLKRVAVPSGEVRVRLALGHATPRITLNTCVGEWPDTGQETSAIMDAALGQVPRMRPPAGRLR